MKKPTMRLDLDSPEEIESDERPLNELPPPGMEDVVHHWEVSRKVLMPFSSPKPHQGKGTHTSSAKRVERL